jgi:hypothetical protein
MSTMIGSRDVGTGPPPRDPLEETREARRDFTLHVTDYAVVNGFLIFFWALSAGYFWPAWVLAVWGLFLALHAWKTFAPRTRIDLAPSTSTLRRRWCSTTTPSAGSSD